MLIKILANVICDKKAVKQGDVVEASISSARTLISMGKAEEAAPVEAEVHETNPAAEEPAEDPGAATKNKKAEKKAKRKEA